MTDHSTTDRQWAIVYYRGLPHVMNVRVVRRALRDRQIAGDFYTTDGLADRVKASSEMTLSRSTVSRFLSGRRTSLTTALAILDALKLTFDQVFLEISPALLAKLQDDGMIRYDRGAQVVAVGFLTWPEANEVRAHFGYSTLANPDRQALLAADEQERYGIAGSFRPVPG